ncbi:hypothetical protein Tco_1128173, partial [Tanacetum coccineum]
MTSTSMSSAYMLSESSRGSQVNRGPTNGIGSSDKQPRRSSPPLDYKHNGSYYVATFNKRNIAEVYLKAITEFPVMGVVVSLLGLLKRSQMERVMTLRPTDDYGCYDDPQSFVYRWLQMVMEDTVQVADQWAIAWILEVSSLVLRVANGDERQKWSNEGPIGTNTTTFTIIPATFPVFPGRLVAGETHPKRHVARDSFPGDFPDRLWWGPQCFSQTINAA